MTYAETLSERERKRGRLYAYASTWFGCISEVMIDSSAIVILFIGMNKGSGMLAMLSTGFSSILSMILMIPCAKLSEQIGLKRSVKYACLIGCAGFLLMAAAPYFGQPLAPYVVLTGCLIYSIQRPLYGATWYPLLDNFLRPKDRGDFFGTMRFTYMILSGGLFFLLGLAMGKNPPFWLMELILAGAGLLFLGRWFFINLFPLDPMLSKVPFDLKRTLGISIRNAPLVGWSVYVCLLTIAYTSIFPLAMIYLKSYVGLGAGRVQMISTVHIAGNILGFFCYGTMLRRTSLKTLEIGVHITFLFMSFLLFLLEKNIPGFQWYVSGLLFLTGFATSTFLCNHSTEMMALARPGNKTMAAAFCTTYQSIGGSIGRLGTSFLLGFPLLSPAWSAYGLDFSKYQTLFLSYAAIAVVILFLLPLLPSVVPKHEDYYEP